MTHTGTAPSSWHGFTMKGMQIMCKTLHVTIIVVTWIQVVCVLDITNMSILVLNDHVTYYSAMLATTFYTRQMLTALRGEPENAWR